LSDFLTDNIYKMITKEGYSKDHAVRAEGICVTWGKDLIEEKGGLISFIRHFEKTMKDENCLWLQKCKNKPIWDIIYVYVIVCNQVRYRLYYGGHETGEAEIVNGDGHSWSSMTVISWPRIILAGPFEKAPIKIYRKGFQGFRYCTKLF
jgi:hypothetical protein